MRTLLSKVLLICKDNFAIYTIGVPYRITRSLVNSKAVDVDTAAENVHKMSLSGVRH